MNFILNLLRKKKEKKKERKETSRKPREKRTHTKFEIIQVHSNLTSLQVMILLELAKLKVG